MVEFVNKVTGGKMWVADDRVEEYKAAGHKPAVAPKEKPATKAKSSKKKEG